MGQTDRVSNADLVYDVLRSAGQPLTFQEIFDEVNRRQPVTTREPKATLRSALTQGRQLVSLGDGHYGYLPHLVNGCLLRVPLTEKKPADHPLVYPDEVRQALWPSFLEIQKRTVRRPVQVRLPGGDMVALSLEFLGPGVWGSPLPKGLRNYLAESRAAAGDSLLVKVIEGEAGLLEARLESRRQRNEPAVRRRNQELADLAYHVLHRNLWREVPIWDLVIALLGRGAYRADVTPDPLQTVLKGDHRFTDAGLKMWMLSEAITPDVLGNIRQRKEVEPSLLGIQHEIAPPTSLRRSMEQTMADLGALLSQHEFDSVEDANAFLQKTLAKGGPPTRRAETPLAKAQDLMYDAWEAAIPRDRVRIARQALAISPDCADAYVLLAEETARSAPEAANLYAKGVAAGERALGKQAFADDVGHFWGVIETRPYMRARLGLAQVLWEMDRRQEAIGHAWDMLRLNPGDNHGVRDALLGWLLEAGDNTQVKELLDKYPGDGAATWVYGRTLYAFRSEGDSQRARSLLADALKANRYVPAYLLGITRLPDSLPDMMSFGDESEAIVCADEQLAAWRGTPGARRWLGAHAQEVSATCRVGSGETTRPCTYRRQYRLSNAGLCGCTNACNSESRIQTDAALV
jgi:hypothetical protein